MRWISILATLTAIGLIGLTTISRPSTAVTAAATAEQITSEADPVFQSFERELNHEPAPTAPARREAIDGDALYQAINRIHWSEDLHADAHADEHLPMRTSDNDHANY